MGWGSGSTLFSSIIEALTDTDIEEDIRKEVYKILIPAFEEFDCDTLQDCLGEDKVFDKAYRELNPEEEEEEELDYEDD